MKMKEVRKYLYAVLKGAGAGIAAYILIYLVRILGLLATTSINGYHIETVTMWIVFLLVTLAESTKD